MGRFPSPGLLDSVLDICKEDVMSCCYLEIASKSSGCASHASIALTLPLLAFAAIVSPMVILRLCWQPRAMPSMRIVLRVSGVDPMNLNVFIMYKDLIVLLWFICFLWFQSRRCSNYASCRSWESQQSSLLPGGKAANRPLSCPSNSRSILSSCTLSCHYGWPLCR